MANGCNLFSHRLQDKNMFRDYFIEAFPHNAKVFAGYSLPWSVGRNASSARGPGQAPGSAGAGTWLLTQPSCRGICPWGWMEDNSACLWSPRLDHSRRSVAGRPREVARSISGKGRASPTPIWGFKRDDESPSVGYQDGLCMAARKWGAELFSPARIVATSTCGKGS